MSLPRAETRRNKRKPTLVKSMDCDLVRIMSLWPVLILVGKKLNMHFNSR